MAGPWGFLLANIRCMRMLCVSSLKKICFIKFCHWHLLLHFFFTHLNQLVCHSHRSLVIPFILIVCVGLSVKVITVIIPQEEKDKAEVRKVSLTSNKELQTYLKNQRGAFLYRQGEERDLIRLEDLDHEVQYVIGGGKYNAITGKKKRSQVEDRVFELEAALAVQESLKTRGIDAHIHNNVKIIDPESGNDIMEVDAVVHVGGENVIGSTAYLVECALTPQKNDVEKITKKVEEFKVHSKMMSHFSSVVEVVPVLAGRNWLPETIDECRKSRMKLWRVCPSSKSLQVICS
jgi:hypothetical protein